MTMKKVMLHNMIWGHKEGIEWKISFLVYQVNKNYIKPTFVTILVVQSHT